MPRNIARALAIADGGPHLALPGKWHHAVKLNSDHMASAAKMELYGAPDRKRNASSHRHKKGNSTHSAHGAHRVRTARAECSQRAHRTPHGAPPHQKDTRGATKLAATSLALEDDRGLARALRLVLAVAAPMVGVCGDEGAWNVPHERCV